MKTENFVIRFNFRGKMHEVPVRIVVSELGQQIAVVYEGAEICFERDDHDGLRATTHQQDFDQELLYQIGKALQAQC